MEGVSRHCCPEKGEIYSERRSGPTHLSAGTRCIGPSEPGSTSAAGSAEARLKPFWGCDMADGTPSLTMPIKGSP